MPVTRFNCSFHSPSVYSSLTSSHLFILKLCISLQSTQQCRPESNGRIRYTIQLTYFIPLPNISPCSAFCTFSNFFSSLILHFFYGEYTNLSIRVFCLLKLNLSITYRHKLIIWASVWVLWPYSLPLLFVSSPNSHYETPLLLSFLPLQFVSRATQLQVIGLALSLWTRTLIAAHLAQPLSLTTTTTTATAILIFVTLEITIRTQAATTTLTGRNPAIRALHQEITFTTGTIRLTVTATVIWRQRAGGAAAAISHPTCRIKVVWVVVY